MSLLLLSEPQGISCYEHVFQMLPPSYDLLQIEFHPMTQSPFPPLSLSLSIVLGVGANLYGEQG